jgi:hypothetical protein
MVAVNDGLRFVLEMGALAAVGYWGWRTGGSWPTRLALAVAAVLVVAAVWAVFRADDGAIIQVSTAVRVLIEVAVFAAAAAALVAVGRPRLAALLAVVAAVNEVLNYTLT